MEIVEFTLLLSFISSLLSALIHFYLYMEYQNKFFFYWCFSWILYSLRFILALQLLITPQNILILILYQLSILGTGLFLLWGAYLFFEKQFSKYWIFPYIFEILIILGFSLIDLGNIDLSLRDKQFFSIVAIFLSIGSIQIYIGINFIIKNYHKVFVNYFAGIVFILIGFHNCILPIIKRLGFFQELNYLLDIILDILIAISLLLVYGHKTNIDYIRNKEKYIESMENLAISEQKFQVIVRYAPDIIFTVNRDKKITFINKVPPGIKLNDAIGQNCIDYVAEDYKEIVAESIDQVFKTGEVTSYETQARGNYGSLEWYSTSLAPISDGNSIKSVLLITRNITEQKLIEKELRIINIIKTQLLNRTSHELKTPLVSIKGFAELLLTKHRDHLNDEMISIINEILNGSMRLEKFVNDIIKTSEFEKREHSLLFQRENLTNLIIITIKELSEKISHREIKMIKDLEDKLPCNVDRNEIKHVLRNLIINAIHYTPPFGTITIKAKQIQKIIVVSITDTGVGIEPEQQKRLFKPFGKIEHYGKGLDLITEGSGLGLYISKSIIKLHGGQMWVESEGKNQGSTFYFSIPTF